MPVPVPRTSKPPAHPVIKHPRRGSADQVNSFLYLTRTLPVSPTGPPPSFGTREQWINSLPSWRRTKPRRIWEDDSGSVQESAQPNQQRLAIPVSSSADTGTCVQACISPLHTLLENRGSVSPMGCDGDADDEMSSDCSVVDQSRYEIDSQWSAGSSAGYDMDVEDPSDIHTAVGFSAVDLHHSGDYNAPLYERGAFTPVFEEDSAGHEVTSSPLEPITPFGQFVDRAVAAAQTYIPYDDSYPVILGQPDCHDIHQSPSCDPHCYQIQPIQQPMEPVPAGELIVTPSASDAYKKLAEPLAGWVANYVWKACTTGMSLPAVFSQPSSHVKQYPLSPPSHLATAIHSLLLSTLLQPSAVFLALWYIVRLPVFFDAAGLDPNHVKEVQFRAELLGHTNNGPDRDGMESSAPFKLILLGCMLANKWLDDHTFSNKTWHSISNVPVHSLNKLEYLTLDIFSYDLSISSHTWSRWLAHVMSYHLSLSSPSHPQPISRPSANPYSIVRMTIEELSQAPVACSPSQSSSPEPVFLGLEERRKEKLEKEQAFAESCVDVLEIDLDEDGPLREEYLPKRRVSGVASIRNSVSMDGTVPKKQVQHDWESRSCPRLVGAEKALPPPAKWSPAGDEPILRERNHVSGPYLAVQPPLTAVGVTPYRQVSQVAPRHSSWSIGVGYGGSYHPVQPVYHPYPLILPIPTSHTRSHSYRQDDFQTCGHLPSHSQPRFEYRCSDIRMTANELGPAPIQLDAHWPAADHQYGYLSYGYPFGQLPSVNYHTAWT